MNRQPRIDKRIYPATGKVSWEVDAGKINGKRHRRAFSTEEEAKGYVQRLRVQLARHGQEVFTLDAFQVQQAKAAFELLKPYGAPSLVEVVRFYIERKCPVQGHLLLSEVLERLLLVKERQGKRARYLDDLRRRISKFIRETGDRPVADVTQDEVDGWLYGDRTLAAQTVHNNFRNLRVLFNHAVRIQALAVSPMDGIEPPTVDREVRALTIEEAKSLLEAALATNGTLELLPYVTLAMFCGIRSAELHGLTWREVKLSAAQVVVPQTIAKKRRVRSVEIPKNALAWLNVHRGSREGRIAPPGIAKRFQKLAREAGLWPWPTNAMRHSFGSYFYALTEDSAKTCARLGHRNDAVLFDHYRAFATKAEAARYFDILPPDGLNAKPYDGAESVTQRREEPPVSPHDLQGTSGQIAA